MSGAHGSLLDTLTMMVVGVSGQGKSSFANLFLGGNFFEAGATANPVTKDPEIRTNVVDNGRRYAIDTEGFYDGFTKCSVQTKKLFRALNDHKNGVNVIAVVVQGTQPRFSQPVKDMIKFMYDTYFDMSDEILKHMCIVFTCCTETMPDRQLRRVNYADEVKKYIYEISGKNVDSIPMFFVDNMNGNRGFTKNEMKSFNDWISTLKPLTQINENAMIGGTRTVEIKHKEFDRNETVKVDENTEQTYSIYVTKRRFVWTPNDHEDPTFTDWEEVDSIKELVETKTVEKQFNVDLGGGKKVDRHRTIVKNEITGEVTTSDWINDSTTITIVQRRRRRGFFRKLGRLFR